jgi:hypothetical protein
MEAKARDESLPFRFLIGAANAAVALAIKNSSKVFSGKNASFYILFFINYNYKYKLILHIAM